MSTPRRIGLSEIIRNSHRYETSVFIEVEPEPYAAVSSSSVRTSAFHAGDSGSNPDTATISTDAPDPILAALRQDEHTPGPWFASEPQEDEYGFLQATVGPFCMEGRELQDHVEETICYVSGVNHHCAANAALIASAPELKSKLAAAEATLARVQAVVEEWILLFDGLTEPVHPIYWQTALEASPCRPRPADPHIAGEPEVTKWFCFVSGCLLGFDVGMIFIVAVLFKTGQLKES